MLLSSIFAMNSKKDLILSLIIKSIYLFESDFLITFLTINCGVLNINIS